MALRLESPGNALKGSLRLPGDKSISHRALLLASLAPGTSHLEGFLQSGVTDAMIDIVRQLGVTVEWDGPSRLVVGASRWKAADKALDCRNSGTTMRFLAGALAGHAFESQLTGSEGLRRRPMDRIVEPLRLMGAEIQGEDGSSRPPLTIRGGALHGIDYKMPVASAQVKTALLVAGLMAEGSTSLEEPGPARDHTERMLRQLGVGVRVRGRHVELDPPGRPLAPFDLKVPGDFSSAAFLIVAATLVPGSRIEIEELGVNPTRIGLLDSLGDMGAAFSWSDEDQEGAEPTATLRVSANPLRAVEVSGERVVRMIDEFPVFAVAATQAEGRTQVRDAEELRHKESDRIASMATELLKMGAQIEAVPDGFIIDGPTQLRGARVEAHGDHRLAMALAVAGLVAHGETSIEGAGSIRESFPGFVPTLVSLGADIS